MADIKGIERTGNFIIINLYGQNFTIFKLAQIAFVEIVSEDQIKISCSGVVYDVLINDTGNDPRDWSAIADYYDISGLWATSMEKIKTLFSDNFVPTSNPENNLLVIMRNYKVGGESQILFDQLTQQDTVKSMCYAIRFTNCGKNTVMVGGHPLENNEYLDIPGTGDLTLTTDFQIVFDDGTTGRPIVKK